MKKIIVVFALVASSLYACDEEKESSPCGNGQIDQGEQCDAAALGGETCSSQGFYAGALSCAQDCTFDTTQCEEPPTCNEEGTASGIVQPEDSCGEYTVCIDSSDCEPTERCENLPVEGEEFAVACCVPGLRGCLEAGESCEDEFDCESGLCISRDDVNYYCSKQCTDSVECPDPTSECVDMFIMMACVTPE